MLTKSWFHYNLWVVLFPLSDILSELQLQNYKLTHILNHIIMYKQITIY